MKQLKEALIGKSNISKAESKSVVKVLYKFEKKDIDTGDLVILNDYSIGVAIRDDDFSKVDPHLKKYYSVEGTIIFPDWHHFCLFEYTSLPSYYPNMTTVVDMHRFDGLVLIKNAFPIDSLKHSSLIWEWFSKDKKYKEFVPSEIVSKIN